MPCPLQVFSQSDYLIQVVDTNSHTYHNSNSADLDQLASSDLHCLQRQGTSRFSRTRVNIEYRIIIRRRKQKKKKKKKKKNKNKNI